MSENPLIAHDLTEVRKAAMKNIAKAHDEEELVNEAMKVTYYLI